MNINLIRLKPVVKELDRIATVLELLLAEAYGVRIGAAAPKAAKREESETLYATDDSTFKRDVEDVFKWQRNPERVVDAEDDDGA